MIKKEFIYIAGFSSLMARPLRRSVQLLYYYETRKKESEIIKTFVETKQIQPR